jgi:predicted nucleotidyltransferase
MRRADVFRILTDHRAGLAVHGVKSLAIFGSVARDQARPDSDVDILVEFDRPIGLFEFFELQEQLEDILGRSVDLGTPSSLKDRVRSDVLRDLIHVY